MKTELREEVSGHSGVSDADSDSDSPTEVNTENSIKCLSLLISHVIFRIIWLFAVL